MSNNISIDLVFNSAVGSRGSGNDQFDYPSGIDFINSQFYITDRQNQRVKIYTDALVYSSNFGTYGTGALELNFPLGISLNTAGDIFVANSANHRITKFTFSGTQYDFGSLGTGYNEFNYPVDVKYSIPYIYVADKLNHKIKIYNVALGTPVFINEITGLNFPESVEIFNNQIVVANSADKTIQFYDLGGVYQTQISDSNWVYPNGLCNINDEILVVIDEQDSTLYFYDVDGNLLNTFSTGLNFPKDCVFVDEKLYITDSANHRIVVLDTFIVENIPYLSAAIRNLTRQLYPTGRAWWLVINSIFDKLHQGLSYSEARAYENDLSVLDAILPDNDNYTTTDAENHESVYGIVSNSAVSLVNRKKAITRKMQYPGNIPARQDYRYIQAQLQEAGFDVYIHENRTEVGFTYYDLFTYDSSRYDSAFISSGYTVIANYVDESKDASFNIGGPSTENFLFWVGGLVYGSSANVDDDRKNEFRELILKLKPANMAGLLRITYI